MYNSNTAIFKEIQILLENSFSFIIKIIKNYTLVTNPLTVSIIEFIKATFNIKSKLRYKNE